MAEQIKTKVSGVTGLYRVHTRGCSGKQGIKCRCKGGYQALVFDSGAERILRANRATRRDALTWRSETVSAIRQGTVQIPSRQTFNEAADALLAGMRDSTIENRSGRPYRPSTIRRYELALTKHLRPHLGRLKLTDINRGRVKRLIADWRRSGMEEPSSIRNNLDPLRVIVREAREDGVLKQDPLAGQRLPQGGGRREHVADRAEAQMLIDALPESERAMWACAFYGGLRRGELKALRWSDVDFTTGVIRVERGWDDVEGAQATKTTAGERAVPLAGVLRAELRAHKLTSKRHGEELVFGRTAVDPFVSSTVRARALTAWKAENDRRLKDAADPELVELLQPITLHEARHSAASYMHDAGLTDLEMTTMIGHSDVRTTHSIYTHLFPDSGEKVVAKLDKYLTAEGRMNGPPS
jgi:integrase